MLAHTEVTLEVRAVTRDGKTVFIKRQTDGVLTASKHVCTHLVCVAMEHLHGSSAVILAAALPHGGGNLASQGFGQSRALRSHLLQTRSSIRALGARARGSLPGVRDRPSLTWAEKAYDRTKRGWSGLHVAALGARGSAIATPRPVRDTSVVAGSVSDDRRRDSAHPASAGADDAAFVVEQVGVACRR